MRESIDGYHGTSKEKMGIILSTKEYLPGGNFRDWLGRGIYFFEKDKHQAFMFSKFRNSLPDEKIGVLYTKLLPQNIIDLTIDEDRKFIEKYAQSLKEKLAEKEAEIGHWEHKEGYVLDFLFNVSPYDLVKANYNVPGKKKEILRKKKNIMEYVETQTQICVKESSCIDKGSIREVDCNAYRRIQKRSIKKIK